MPLGWGIRLGRRLLDLGRARSAEFAARELAPACWIKAIDRLDDPDRPDLHEVIEWLSPVRVPARKRANERHVVEDEPLTLGRVERSWLRCHAAGGRSFQGWEGRPRRLVWVGRPRRALPGGRREAHRRARVCRPAIPRLLELTCLDEHFVSVDHRGAAIEALRAHHSGARAPG